MEDDLRKAKFGYRAKFISGSISKIKEFGGLKWFEDLKALTYQEARQELLKLPGIGYKVADCICLMSLGHLESVPIDTHIFQIAQQSYMPEALKKAKSVTPKIYDDISNKFRDIYGEYAGWAQAVSISVLNFQILLKKIIFRYCFARSYRDSKKTTMPMKINRQNRKKQRHIKFTSY